MRLTTDALIIRENNNIGESDRFVTALTRELGAVHASARGARTLKNRGSVATRLLSYSRLTLREGRSRDKYIIEDARPLRVFFDIHGDIARLALAQYFCELAGVLAPREEPAEEHLRLLLNALHFLTEGKRDLRLIKAVVELRLLTLSGYMPTSGPAPPAVKPTLPFGSCPGTVYSAVPGVKNQVMPCLCLPPCWPRCGTSYMRRLKSALRSRSRRKPSPPWRRRRRPSCFASWAGAFRRCSFITPWMDKPV